MKLDEEQIKKIGLSLAVFAILLYGYFAFLLGPLLKSERDSISGIASLEPRIADAKAQIARTAELETKGASARAFLANLKNTIPDAAPIAWFPPRMASFFKDHGMEKCTTHLVSESPDRMPGFRKIVWAVDLPKAEFNKFGLAIASLENDEPLLQIRNLSIDANGQDPLHQHVSMILTTLVKS